MPFPHNLHSGYTLTIYAICHSMNITWVVVLIGGGGDTSKLHVLIRVVWTFCTQRWWAPKNQFFNCPYILAPCHNALGGWDILTKHALIKVVPFYFCAFLPLHPCTLHPITLVLSCPFTLVPSCSFTLAPLCPFTHALLCPFTLVRFHPEPSNPCRCEETKAWGWVKLSLIDSIHSGIFHHTIIRFE